LLVGKFLGLNIGPFINLGVPNAGNGLGLQKRKSALMVSERAFYFLLPGNNFPLNFFERNSL
jgi:hypothetical protein